MSFISYEILITNNKMDEIKSRVKMHQELKKIKSSTRITGVTK